VTAAVGNDWRSRLLGREDAAREAREVREGGGRVVLTNGCFDLLHRGHVDLLEGARSLGDLLLVALNTDASVRRLKGPGRPLQTEEDRARLLLALRAVDRVVLFDEDTPGAVIGEIRPDVLVKGEEYGEPEIVGADLVRSYGGDVVRVPMTPSRSTSKLIDSIRSLPGKSRGRSEEEA
jgi:rfaE bifunctional protein nucleotidyltransferase chain/domain